MKKIVIFSLIFTLTLIVSTFSVGASPTDSEEINKIPDALNQDLEEKKLQELKKDKDQKGITLELNKPLVVEFDDGSSITYTSTIDQDNSFSTTSSGNLHFKVTKSYNWSAGGADITSHVANVDINTTQHGYELVMSGDSNDIYQTAETAMASVTPTLSRAKYIWMSLYDKGIRAQARGTISYDVFGWKHDTSYDFVWEANPRTLEVTYVSSY